MSPRSRPADERTSRKFLRQNPTEFIGALARTKLPGEATRLIAYLYDRANPEKPLAFITLKNAARDMGISEWTVKRALDVLENNGRVAVKVLASGTRIVVVKPLPAPNRTPPDTWAKQIEQVWEELGVAPSSSATPPSSSAGGDEQNRQGRGAELTAPPSSSARENAESPVPERGFHDVITVLNHSPESHVLNHSPEGDGKAVVSDLAEGCRAARRWSWSEKDRRREEETAARFMADGYTAEEILGCLRDAPEAHSLAYVGPRLAAWKAAQGFLPGCVPCWKCGIIVVMQRGDLLRGVQVGDRWQHLSCPGTVLACLACGKPVDPVVSARKMEENKQEFEATTAIAGYELGRLPDGRMAVTHADGCEESAWAAYDEAKEKPSSP